MYTMTGIFLECLAAKGQFQLVLQTFLCWMFRGHWWYPFRRSFKTIKGKCYDLSLDETIFCSDLLKTMAHKIDWTLNHSESLWDVGLLSICSGSPEDAFLEEESWLRGCSVLKHRDASCRAVRGDPGACNISGEKKMLRISKSTDESSFSLLKNGYSYWTWP